MKKILFLDIDGVLCSMRCRHMNDQGYDPVAVEWVKVFCSKHGFNVVISSSRKIHQPTLQNFMEETGLIDCVLHPESNLKRSCTPNMEQHRGNEIHSFIQSLDSPDVLMVVLDDIISDMDILKEQYPDNLFISQTYFADGLVSRNMDEIVNFVRDFKTR